MQLFVLFLNVILSFFLSQHVSSFTTLLVNLFLIIPSPVNYHQYAFTLITVAFIESVFIHLYLALSHPSFPTNCYQNASIHASLSVLSKYVCYSPVAMLAELTNIPSGCW